MIEQNANDGGENMQNYLFVSDFDKTLSVQDAGELLSLKLGIPSNKFFEKIEGLTRKAITKHGAELTYLILHDPDYRGKVTKKLLSEVGSEIQLKRNIPKLIEILSKGIEGKRFHFYVISAAPQEIVTRALEGILPPANVNATKLIYDEDGVVRDVKRVAAGSMKLDILNRVRAKEKIPLDRTIYVGDGFSDMYLMLHLRVYGGYPIGVTPSPYIGHVSRRTVVSEDALSLLIPILEDILKFSPERIQSFFEGLGHQIQNWRRAKVEWVELLKT
jgi:HAD superfamily phosphoserine phosphatase-like hydrolase